MVVYGFVKDFRYDGDGTLEMQIRVPLIHGPYKQKMTKGTYTLDKDLPWYRSVLLPILPSEGDVVALISVSESRSSDFIVMGLTGGNYHNGSRI